MGEKSIQIGSRIKRIRQENSITQRDLAEALKVSQTAVALWENGSRNIPIEVVDDIANILNVSAGYLLFGHKDIEDATRLNLDDQITYALNKIAQKGDFTIVNNNTGEKQTLSTGKLSDIILDAMKEHNEHLQNKKKLKELSQKATDKLKDSKTTAAHLDGKDFTEEQWKQIKSFAEFIKSQSKDAPVQSK